MARRAVLSGFVAFGLVCVAPVLLRAAEPAAKAGEAKAGEAKSGTAKASEAIAAGSKAVESKPGEAKSVESKPGEAKSVESKAGAATTTAKTDAPSTKARGRRKASASEPTYPVGEGPSPASPPPLTIASMRGEKRRESVGTPGSGPSPRSRLEDLLGELAKARAAMHEDTQRLEALMLDDSAKGEAAPEGGATPAAAGQGQPPRKNPLDILAKALRGIKPEQAAPIVTRLDKHLAAVVLQRMPPADAGQIMGAMKPEVAAELATQIAAHAPKGDVKR